MQIKNKKVLIIFVILSLITVYSLYWKISSSNSKIAVVDAVKLFDGYNMKLELEQAAKMKLLAIDKQLDSVRNQLQIAVVSKDEINSKKLSLIYNALKNSLESEYKQSNHDINEQVWKRLNSAMEEFGRKKGLHLIIGANGTGNVLYNDEYYDQTNEAIKFINKRYAEGN